MFRVDDVVRPCGCSNKTAGTRELLIQINVDFLESELKII